MVHTKKIPKNNSYHKKNELHVNLKKKKKKTLSKFCTYFQETSSVYPHCKYTVIFLQLQGF